jgi:hypothetical protein
MTDVANPEEQHRTCPSCGYCDSVAHFKQNGGLKMITIKKFKRWLRKWIRIEAFFSNSFWISLGIDEQNDGLKFNIGIPPVSISIMIPTKKTNEAYLGIFGFEFFSISFHGGTLYWKFMTGADWTRGTPRWQDGALDFKDLILGKPVYSKQLISTSEVLIPMPEGNYPATVEMHLDTWSRPRSPIDFKTMRCSVEIPNGIPFQGKGENSWDCGEDRCFSLTAPAISVKEAIEKTRESVMRDRKKNDCGETYPDPMEVLK